MLQYAVNYGSDPASVPFKVPASAIVFGSNPITPYVLRNCSGCICMIKDGIHNPILSCYVRIQVRCNSLAVCTQHGPCDRSILCVRVSAVDAR